MTAELLISQRLLRLERRIDRVEQYLHIHPLADEVTDPPRVQLEPAVQGSQAAIRRDRSAVATTSEPLAIPLAAAATPLSVQPIAYAGASPATGLATDAPRSALRPTSRRSPASGQLEQTIGLKWAGWVGAIVLVVGAVLGVRYAYENNLLPTVSPAGRLAMIFAAGAALLVAGEYVYRKVHRVSAASLFGAGVATLFVAAYVGHAHYELYARNIAMVLMGAASLIGALVAMRGNLVSIAVLSLIGANLAPMLASTRNPTVASLLGYLLAMQVVALVLASWGRGGKWWTLRGLSLASVALWMTGVLLGRHAHDPAVLPFLIGYAALYHAELIVTTLRRAGASGLRRTTPGTAFTVAVVAALTGGLLLYFANSSDRTRAVMVLSLAGASLLGGVALPRLLLSLGAIAQAHRIAAAALLVLAVPVATSGVNVEVGWVALGLAFGASWATARSRVSRAAAPFAWLMAVAHLASRVSDPAREVTTLLRIVQVDITVDLALAWGIALAGHAIARLAIVGADREGKKRAGAAVWLTVLSVLASTLFVSSSVSALPPLGATVAIITYAWLLLAADRAAVGVLLAPQAIALVVLATGKWFVFDTLLHRVSGDWSATQYVPVLNPMVIAGALSCGSLVAMYRFKSRKLLIGAGDRVRRVVTLSAAALVFLSIAWMGTLEIDRAVERGDLAVLFPGGAIVGGTVTHVKSLLFTGWWSVLSAIAYVIGRRLDRNAPARAAWAVALPWIVIAIAAKYLVADALLWRAMHRAVPWSVMVNPEALAAGLVEGALVLVRIRRSDAHARPGAAGGAKRLAAAMLVGVLLVAGTLEVDRAFALPSVRAALDNARLAQHVALSIFWATFAGASIGIGFRIGAARLRYFGLALLALTLLKVVMIDLSQVDTGYRILSFIGLGIVLLATSVLYGKASPNRLSASQ